MGVQQMLHELRIINGGSSLTHFNLTKAGGRFKSQENTASAMLGICVMIACRFPRAHGQNRSHLFNKKARAFIKTNQRPLWIIRQGIVMEYIFHTP
jgi:hypothetical protein